MRSSCEEVYISAVSCSCVTCSSNSVASTRAGAMGRPQLGLPRLRVWGNGIAIGPDSTPHEWLRGRFFARVACGLRSKEGRIDFEPAFRSMDAIEAFHVGAVAQQTVAVRRIVDSDGFTPARQRIVYKSSRLMAETVV